MDNGDLGPAMAESAARDHTKRVEARVAKLEAKMAQMHNAMNGILQAYEAGRADRARQLQGGEE